ncbi:LysR family transcriptional regulator [Shewanella maritima]|uniref:LysR family transcriptional regulator n=1 Tax=Shewanella maritima TaxID=2520507 RepID=UPI003735BEF1
MELRQIKHFVLLAEIKHYNKAARILNITQPTLTRSIQRLETLVGGQLLVRNAKVVSLTTLGIVVLKHGQRLLKESQELEEQVTLFHGVHDACLRVGSSPLPANNFVAPIVGSFMQAFPNLSIDVSVADGKDLYQMLLRHELDFFIAESKVTQLEHDFLLDITPLSPFKAVFSCRRDHPLIGQKRLFLPALRDYPLAIPKHLPLAVQQEFGDLFNVKRHDFSGLVRFEHFPTIQDAMLNSDIVALTSEIAVRNLIEQGSLVQLSPLLMPEIYAEFSVISLRGKKQTAPAIEFIECLLCQAASVRDTLTNETNESVA